MMREKELKKKLMKYTVPAPDSIKIEAGKIEIENKYTVQKNTLSYGEFLLQQIRYMGIRCWLIEAVVLVFLVMCTYNIAQEVEYCYQIAFISALTPFLLVAQAEIIGKSFACRMNELEAATKFSLKHLIIARLCVFGVVDFIILSGWVAYLSSLLDMPIMYVIAYTCVPFNIAAIGMFLILLFDSEKDFFFKAGILSVTVAIFFFVISARGRALYGKEMIDVWYVALGVTTLLQVASAFKLVKKVKSFQMAYGQN